MEMIRNRLWKRYVTACLIAYRFKQPLMETVGNRLWKRYVTACLITYRFRQPLMETVLALPKSLEPQHRQLRLSAEQ
jgi:hypothetical protein